MRPGAASPESDAKSMPEKALMPENFDIWAFSIDTGQAHNVWMPCLAYRLKPETLFLEYNYDQS